jgi:hypothetical protein
VHFRGLAVLYYTVSPVNCSYARNSGTFRLMVPLLDAPRAPRVSDQLAASWLRSARETGAGRVPSAPDSVGATAQTVEVMCSQIAASARDAEVRSLAAGAAARFRGGPFYMPAAAGDRATSDPAALAGSCWWWAKHFIQFELHDKTIRRLLNEADQQQLLISPDVLVRMENRRGDCAIYTELICAFLSVLGVRWEIVTVAANPREPGVFSHVYPRAVLPDGSRLALDASHGKYPGWQVPRAHTSRIQVWDMRGRPVADSDSRWNGLHGYQRGLGDDAEGTPFTYTPDVSTTTTLPDPFGLYNGARAPSPSSFNWGNFVGNLANQWTQIGSRVLAPSTTVQRGANGSLAIVTPGNSPVGSALIGTAAGAGAALPSGLLWLGAGVLAFMVFASMSKGR